MTRLDNAARQRDAEREELLLAAEGLNKLQRPPAVFTNKYIPPFLACTFMRVILWPHASPVLDIT